MEVAGARATRRPKGVRYFYDDLMNVTVAVSRMAAMAVAVGAVVSVRAWCDCEGRECD